MTSLNDLPHLEPLSDEGQERRRFVMKAGGLAAAGFGAGIGFPMIGDAFAATGGAPLRKIPEVRAENGTVSVTVNAQYSQFKLGDKNVTLRCYDGNPVGKAIRFRAGDTVRLTLNNHMPFDPLAYLCTEIPVPGENGPRGFNVTNMHTHGLHVSPRPPQDNVLMLVRPGETFQYVYDIPKEHPPGTYFYHAHFHGSTALQVASGMSGPLIVEGKIDEIPAIKAANENEQILVFQTQRFDKQGMCEDYATLFNGYQVYVNGQVNPVIRMKRGEVQRWRLINGSHLQALNLQLEFFEQNGITPFTLLCLDGNPLPETAETYTITMIAGNRADVLVKGFTEGTYFLTGGQDVGVIATLVVEGDGPDMELYAGPLIDGDEYPELVPIRDDEIVNGRRLQFGFLDQPPQSHYVINNVPFSCDDPWPIPVDTAEEWEVYNHTAEAHPFHIHTNPFQVVAGGGIRPGTFMDTLLLPPFQRIVMRMRFRTFTGTTVFHCHNLMHEDTGMMQAFEIFDPTLVQPKSAG